MTLEDPTFAQRVARDAAGPNEAQLARIQELRERYDVETSTIHFHVQAGSELVIGRSRATGKVALVEIIEPEPTFRWVWDTGEPR